MATHSSILAWTIPWTEAPAGYSPQGCTESYTTEATEHTWVVSTLGNEQPPGLGLTPSFREETWIPAHLLRTPHCQGQSSHLLSPAQAQWHVGFTEPETGGKISPSGKKKKREEKQKPLNAVNPHASLAPQTRGFLCLRAGSPGCITYPQARCSGSFVLDTNTSMDAICWHKTRLPKGSPSPRRHGPWSGPPCPDDRLAVCGATPCYSCKPFPGNSAPASSTLPPLP